MRMAWRDRWGHVAGMQLLLDGLWRFRDVGSSFGPDPCGGPGVSVGAGAAASIGAAQDEAGAANGSDHPWRTDLAELAAQIADVDVDQIVADVSARLPCPEQNLFARDRALLAFEQQGQQRAFAFGQGG